MYLNHALKPKEANYTIKEIELLEAIGIELYKKYGYDRYNYSINGAPVDIDLINNDLEEVKNNIININDVEEAAAALADYYTFYDE